MEQLTYGSHQDQHYDIYVNPNSQSTTWIALIHGGYWREKFDKHMMDPLIDALIDAGYSVINIEYRRGQSHTWPAPSDDVHDAIQHFRNSQFAPRKIISIGHSVGGQIVLLRHTDFDAIVALAPVTDVLYTLHNHLGQDAVPEYFDTHNTNALKVASPLTQLPVETDTLLIHGYNDTSVHIDTSISYVHENYRKGYFTTFYALPYLDHLDCINPEGAHFHLMLSWLKQFATS